MALGILMGFLMGVGASALFVLSRSGKIRVSILSWILIIIAALMAVSGIQNYLGLSAEGETGAATIMAWRPTSCSSPFRPFWLLC